MGHIMKATKHRKRGLEILGYPEAYGRRSGDLDTTIHIGNS